MSVLVVPSRDAEPWPTLGPLVCAFIEENLVFGPGDLLGEPARLDIEKQMFIWRFYELFPRGYEQAGRRRFNRVALSLPNGLAKTEMAAWIAAVELHPEGPVRFDGWNKDGTPNGRPVLDPYIPMYAYTEEQTELLGYGALKAILEKSVIAEDFEIGLERTMRKRGDGKCEPCASSPNAADGGRTSFAHFDETHRFFTRHHKELHSVNLGNMSKRQTADGWTLETTTAPQPGAGSIAEATMGYAQAIVEGLEEGRNFFFFHRQASEDCDLTTEEGAREALLEAYGPAAQWANIEAKMNLWRDPQYSAEDWARFFGNLKVKSEARAFDVDEWKSLAKQGYTIPQGSMVTLGFDGGRTHDSTGLVATEVATGFQQVLGVWEQPYGPAGLNWQAPEAEVDDVVAAAFQQYNVWRMYADPFYWEGRVSIWVGQYGSDRVAEWRTNRPLQMSAAIQAYQTGIQTRALSHDGNGAMARHIGNSFKQELKQRDDRDRQLYYIHKESNDSPNKMDLAMAGCLSWEAYNDCVASGDSGNEWTWGAI